MELAESIITAKQGATQQIMQFKILKKQHEMEMSLVNMIDEVARNAPPPGQGSKLDVTA